MRAEVLTKKKHNKFLNILGHTYDCCLDNLKKNKCIGDNVLTFDLFNKYILWFNLSINSKIFYFK